MTGFAFPWVFLLLPLPLLVRAVLPPVRDKADDALKVPFFDSVAALDASGGRGAAVKKNVLRLLGAAVWLLLIAAAANPVWTGAPVKIPTQGRNLMLVLDVSGSMQEADFAYQNRAIRRWDAVQAVADAFVQKRKGDRVGVVLFGERAYLYVPLSYDVATVSQLLREVDVGMAGTRTAIGDALGVALKTMIDVPATGKVVVLLSDGAANAGVMRPTEAADLAQKAGVKVYTVGVGSDTIETTGLFGTLSLPRGDEIDEKTLKEIAAKTGGKYYRAKNTTDLIEIYGEIDKLEPVKNEDVFARPVKTLFRYPLAAAFVLSVSGALIAAAGRRA